MKPITRTFSSMVILTAALAALPATRVYAEDIQGPYTYDVVAAPNPAIIGTLMTVTATVDDTLAGGSPIYLAELSVNGGAWTSMSFNDGYDGGPVADVTGSFTATQYGDNIVCVRGIDFEDGIFNVVGSPACTHFTVVSVYSFNGFFAPIRTDGNEAEAGRTIPTKWQLAMTADGSPVSDPGAIAGVMSYAVDCNTLAGNPSSAVSESGPSNADLNYLNNGTWLFSWHTPASYGGTCRMLFVSFSDGSTSPNALFRFK